MGKQSGTSFSYKDKLLSLGDSGFLVPNMEATEAMKGWKNYLMEMSERQHMVDLKDSVEDDILHDDEDWSKKGSLPSFRFMRMNIRLGANHMLIHLL